MLYRSDCRKKEAGYVPQGRGLIKPRQKIIAAEAAVSRREGYIKNAGRGGQIYSKIYK
jgi:hypothetical protein